MLGTCGYSVEETVMGESGKGAAFFVGRFGFGGLAVGPGAALADSFLEAYSIAKS
jgi:hypothetical protein